jgi:hypothetical protein
MRVQINKLLLDRLPLRHVTHTHASIFQIAKKAAEAGGTRVLSQDGALFGGGEKRAQGAREAGGVEVEVEMRGEFAAPLNMHVCIEGMVFWCVHPMHLV